MVGARSAFLKRGYYRPLLDGVSDILLKHYNNGLILDAGCGEGYYTQGIARKLAESNINADIIAADISKTAVNAAAKRRGAAEYAVANVYDLPLNDRSVGMVLNVFAPFALSEYMRILKKDGIVIHVMPLENHLLALKQLVYNEAYTNAVKPCETHGLTLCDKHDIKYIFRPDTAGDIMNLFMMTPYYYTSSENDRAKIKNAAFLETEAEFRILVYKLNKI
ncbi:MAG: methyltransferase domain-containing protein [Eubacteriales bacterium]|jgi:23S rRNA (guanine745-N1)-methyltransferase|nr:methyltransferase domain-containing protein [Eubacteriales bacterium]